MENAASRNKKLAMHPDLVIVRRLHATLLLSDINLSYCEEEAFFDAENMCLGIMLITIGC